MAIQSSVNQTLASVAGLLGIGKIAKNQGEIAKNIKEQTSSFDRLYEQELKPTIEAHEAGYNQGVEDINELYDSKTGELVESRIAERMSDPIYEGSTVRAAIKLSDDRLAIRQAELNAQKEALRQRKEQVKKGPLKAKGGKK